MAIPFFTQLVDLSAADLEGFRSIADARYWQERGCGAACLRMILAALRSPAALPRYGDMVYHGLAMNAFCDRGWIHDGLVRMARSYGVNGSAFRHACAEDVAEQIARDHPCIVSITAGFEGCQPGPSGRALPSGGHLAVAFGCRYDDDNAVQGFLVHHPSSWPEYNWREKIIGIRSFEQSFSGNFMAFGTDL
jgi:hypothetical protein